MHPDLIDETQLATLLGVSVHTIKKWRYTGIGPAFLKIQGSVFYRRSELDQYIAAQVSHRPVHSRVSDEAIYAAVDCVLAFGVARREEAAAEVKAWLLTEVGVQLKPRERGAPAIKVGRLVDRKLETAK